MSILLARTTLTLVFASILLAPIVISTNQAFAMGQAPSTCPNRYDATITQMIINNGTETFDPTQNPDVTFLAERHDGYSLSMTLHTTAQSTNGNQDRGTTWYSDNAYGFGNGHCVADVGPNEDKVLTLSFSFPSTMGPPSFRSVQFYTFLNSVAYSVGWYDKFAPKDLSATAVSSSQIDLSWSAPLDDGGSPITGYRIDRYASNTNWVTIESNTGSTSTTYTDTGLFPNTTYQYRVYAINSVGTSPPSNFAWATTFMDVPQPPTDLTATAVSSSQIDLSWSAPSDDGGSPVTGYMIERSAGDGSTWNAIVDNTSSTDTTYSDTGLSSNTTYAYRVSAINSVGTSDPSDTASATTPLISAAGVIVGPIPIPISILHLP